MCLRPQQTSAKGGRIDRAGTPGLDRRGRVGDGGIEPAFGRRATSPQSVELRPEELRNADDVDQRQVETLEPVAALADLAILEYCRGA